jgi:arylsulfatase A-like enzyme
MPKNIVALITDTFRYDNLGDRAERPVRTPALDKFGAERATAVEKFQMASFPTIPHRTDFATGILGWPHYGWQAIDQSGTNHVGRILGQQGYATQLICDCPHLFNARFQQGFDAAFQHRGQEGDKPLLHLNDPIEQVVPDEKARTQPRFHGSTLANTHRWTNRYYRYEADTFSAKTSTSAVRWLEENSDANPFFLWVDFFDPHEPWDPPEYLVRRYDPDYTGTPMIHPNYGRSSVYTPEELHNLWAHYAAESELVDRHIGAILQKVDDLELRDDTIVVVLSDHGMSIGEHGRTGKSNIDAEDPRYWPTYPEIGHTMFLIAGGDVPRGQSVDIIAQPMDILPTLCELAGVPVEPPKPFDGISFAQQILGSGGTHREYAVTGCHLSARGTPPRRATTPFLTTAQWGYAPVGAYGRPELYDLTVDPLAANDIATQNGEVVNSLHQLFIDHLSEHNAPEAFIALWEGLSESDAAGGAWAIDYPMEDE